MASASFAVLAMVLVGGPGAARADFWKDIKPENVIKKTLDDLDLDSDGLKEKADDLDLDSDGLKEKADDLDLDLAARNLERELKKAEENARDAARKAAEEGERIVNDAASLTKTAYDSAQKLSESNIESLRNLGTGILNGDVADALYEYQKNLINNPDKALMEAAEKNPHVAVALNFAATAVAGPGGAAVVSLYLTAKSGGSIEEALRVAAISAVVSYIGDDTAALSDDAVQIATKQILVSGADAAAQAAADGKSFDDVLQAAADGLENGVRTALVNVATTEIAVDSNSYLATAQKAAITAAVTGGDAKAVAQAFGDGLVDSVKASAIDAATEGVSTKHLSKATLSAALTAAAAGNQDAARAALAEGLKQAISDKVKSTLTSEQHAQAVGKVAAITEKVSAVEAHGKAIGDAVVQASEIISTEMINEALDAALESDALTIALDAAASTLTMAAEAQSIVENAQTCLGENSAHPLQPARISIER